MYSSTATTSVSKVTSDGNKEFFSEETSVLLAWNTPTWEKELQDMTVEERDRGVELVCICKDLAHPSAKWFHKGREVFSDFHMKLRQEEGKASLTIKEIREQDTGIFKCVMTGGNGQLGTSCVLTVKASEVILPPVFVKELHDVEVEEGEQLELAVEVREAEHLDPPGFVICPSAVTGKEGETVTFTCQVKGQPPPTVFWEKGGVAIATSQKYKITKIQDQHTLTIYDVTQADAGDYVCQLHGCGRELSHTCSLSITSDLRPGYIQPAETVKTRLVYITDLHEKDRPEGRSTLQQGTLGSPEVPKSIQHNNYRDTDNRSEQAKARVAIEASRASHETKVGAQSTVFVRPSNVPQTHRNDHKKNDHDRDDHNSRHRFQDEHGGDFHDSSSSKKINVSSLPTTKNVGGESSQQQTVPETKPNYHSVLNKAQRRAEEKKAAINTGSTDFRGILKHREKSPSRQTAKSIEQTADLRKSSLSDNYQQSKEQTTKIETSKVYKLVNMPASQSTNTTLSQKAELVSLSHSKSTALSSKEISTSNQTLRNRPAKQSNATGRHGELTSVPNKSANFTYLDSSAPSSMTRHAAGTSDTPASSDYVENVLSEHKLYVSVAPGEFDNECVNVDVYNQQHIVISDDNLTVGERNNAQSQVVSSACFLSDKLLDNNEGEDKSGTVDSASCDQVYVSEIQIKNTRTDDGQDYVTNRSPHREHNSRVSSSVTPSPANHRHASFSGTINVEAETQQESSPPYKVSIVHISPQVPRSSSRPDDFKLEVKSVSMSVPLRSSSSSSPRLHSGSNSVSGPAGFPGQTLTGGAHDRHEDTDDVFDDVHEERKPAQTVQYSNSSNHRTTSQSFGPTFTWEKAPWDMQKSRQDDSTFDHMNMTEFESEDISLLENTGVSDSNHQWERSFISPDSVNSKIRSASDCDILPSHVTSKRSFQAVNSTANDFRTVKLKPAASKVKSDLIRSKFMSASTECVFADVKLKSVSNMNDRWRKSQVSLNTDRFQGVPPQSRDSLPRSRQDLSQQTLRTSSQTVKTTLKLTENLHAPVNNAKSPNQNENEKSVNKSKIKTVAEKYEKSPPVTAPRTKSKGIGAKFEASIKDSKVTNKNTFGSLPDSVKKNTSETKTSKSAVGGDVKPGKVFEKIQHWKVAEIKLSENSDKKMLGSLGKSNSHGNVLERGKDTDKILESNATHKRHSLQTDVITKSQIITVAKSEIVPSIKAVSRTSQMFERAKVSADLEASSETSRGQIFDQNTKDIQTLKPDSVSGKSVQQIDYENNGKDSILDEKKLKTTASGKFKIETSENKPVNVNKVELSARSKGGSPKSAQSRRDAKPELIIRKPLNIVETKIRANISDKNQQTKTKSEWSSSRSSKQYQQTESTKENKHMAEFKTSPGLRNTRKDEQNSFVHVTCKKSGADVGESQEANIASLDSKQLVGSNELNDGNNADVFGKSAVSNPSNNIKTQIPLENVKIVQTATLITKITPTVGFFDSPAMTSNVLASSEMSSSSSIAVEADKASPEKSHPRIPAETPCSIPIAKDPTTFRRSSVTQGLLEETKVPEASVDPSPVCTTATAGKYSPPDHSKHMQALNEPSSEDHLSHVRNFKSSWIRQKHQKSVPAHQPHDMGLILYQEQLRSSMDDSESVLSTTSISSSSSDASSVTVDSGYPRYSSRKYLDNDRIELQSKISHPEKTTSVTVSHPGKLDKEVKNTADSFQKKKNFFEHADNKNNTEGQFKLGDGDRNIQILASNLKHTTGARETCETSVATSEGIPGLGTGEGPQFTSDSIASVGLNQTSNQRRQFVNEVTIVQKTFKEDSKSTDQVIEAQDTEDVPDLTNDFGTIRKYSKKRRKQIQIDINNGTVVLTSPDAETPTSRSVEGIKTLETAEVIIAESNITLEPDKTTDKCKTKETRTNVESEGANHKSTLTRRWRVQENLNADKDNKQKTKPDNRPPVTRPADLDLTTRWRHRKLNVKTDTENEDVKITSEIQEEVNQSLAVPLSGTSVTSTSAAPSVEPPRHQCPPSFPIPLRDTKVILGSTAVLFCQVIGDPQPEVKWLLNYQQLEPSENIEILYSQDIAQLTVQETFTEHVGDYSCWAKNLLGTVSTHCTLTLEASNKTESRAFEGPIFVPPKIVSFAPSALTLARGACLSLTVKFLGEPRPAVRWMRGDTELTSDNHVQIVTETSSSCLTIESVTRSDAGKMSVCLTSSTGADQASTNIYIEDVPGCPVGRPHVYEIDRNSASLSWCGPAYSEGCQVTHYIIESKTSQDQAWDVIVPHCKDQSCHILGLKPCTTYQFRVLAANKYGLSAPSEPSEGVYTSDPYRSPSDYESEDDLPFEPREVKINMGEQFEDVYELHKEVGKGKFGIVYKCKHKRDETIWAAKIVKCREQDKKVIRREIEIMNKLRHPKLLMLWDAYEAPRQMVLVTEFVSAGELFERVIGEDFVLTECDCIHFLRQICEGVNYMHSNNILHLDLKPENILCIAENSNRIKIIDFGLAQFYHPGQSTKVLFGTPEFIAPEVINYDEIGFATDMWSIGVICYVLLSGLSPFLGDNDAETLASVTSGEYDFDDEAFDEISDDAKDFISRLLVKKKEHRLLTDQCLSHVWLAQHESGSVRRRRLNTERLKRFMVRRKWLKTGNAVLAVSRLLKSTNLGALSSLSNNGGGCNESSDTESSVSSPKFAVQRSADADLQILQNKSIPEKTVRNQPISNLWRNTSPEELTNAVENANVGQLSEVGLVQLRNSDFTDQNDNQIDSSHLAASSSDDNHNINLPMPASTDSVNSVSSLITVSCSSSATEIRNDITTEAVQGSTAHEDRLPSAPLFMKSMINSDACIGDVARFDVVIAGYPLPVVTWCFEGEQVHSDSRHTVEINETTRSFSLIIRGIVEEDEGEYTCKAVNSQGEAICVAELSVLDM